MSREFPDFVDPWKAADGQRGFDGTVPLARLKRLLPLLAPIAAGDVAAFSARFGRDDQGQVTIDLRVEAALPLVCQRSMEPYREPVRRRSLLAVIEDRAQEDTLPGHYEPVLVEHGRLALAELVEDELLLALPEVPRNPEVAEVWVSTAGTEVEETEDERRHRPFEGLAELMGKGGGKSPDEGSED